MSGRVLSLAMGILGTIKVAAENAVIPRPTCDAAAPISFRYAISTRRIYIEAGEQGRRGGCATITDVYDAIKGTTDALHPVEQWSGTASTNLTGIWLLREELYVLDGITLNVIGGTWGDCDELRLLSGGSNYTVINLRAHGGSLNFRHTKVTTYDEETNSPDMVYHTGRSYISAITEVITDSNETCSGRAKNNKGEARMDIYQSEMAYLGWFDSESYGLVWKVRGFCTDKSNPEVFDSANVYGNIYDSDIHHNYFGVYTYGHQNGDWRRNAMWAHIQYGFDPHDNSDYLNIHDNDVHDNGNHGIIASVDCDGLSIQNNEVYQGQQAGIFLHRNSNGAIVKGNNVHDNQDAGMALMESSDSNITENTFQRNKYGVRLSVGARDNNIFDNNIFGSFLYNLYVYTGSDQPWVEPTARPQRNKLFNNHFWCTTGTTCINLSGADETEITNNRLNNMETARFSNSTETLVEGNYAYNASALVLDVKSNSCFAVGSDPLFTPIC